MSRIMTPRNPLTDTLVRFLRPVVAVEDGVKAVWDAAFYKVADPIDSKARVVDLWRDHPWNCMWTPLSMWFRFVLGFISELNWNRRKRLVETRNQRAEHGKYVWTLANLLESLRELKAQARAAGLPPK